MQTNSNEIKQREQIALRIRPYQPDDYTACEALVNQAWKFDDIFSPEALADIAKSIYTKGSVIEGNYKAVAEHNGKLIGFLFGRNEYGPKPRGKLAFSLKIMWRLIRVKSVKPNGKGELFKAINQHEVNRRQVISNKGSEVVLFVIDKNSQKQGLGTALWHGFEEHCRQHKVKSIIVETNTLGASKFYEKLGFNHLADFESPLHEFSEKGGQACIYEYAVD